MRNSISKLALFFRYEYSPFQYSDANNSAYGLFGWGLSSPASLQNFYGDDNVSAKEESRRKNETTDFYFSSRSYQSRVLLGSIVSSSLLNSSKWDAGIVKGLLGNLRTTGQGGFRDATFTAPQIEGETKKLVEAAAEQEE